MKPGKNILREFVFWKFRDLELKLQRYMCKDNFRTLHRLLKWNSFRKF